MSINLPKGDLVNDSKGTREFMTFLKLLADNANIQYGTTADRPTRYIQIGYQYYDTTLGKPVFVSSLSPIVWRDAAGTVV